MTGEQRVTRHWVLFFWAAAIFNWIVGFSGMVVPGVSIDSRMIGVLVFAFGVVYWLVARDPLRYASVLWAGVIGKLGIVGLLVPTVFSAEGDTVVGILLVADLLFAIGFLAFLFSRNDEIPDEYQG